MTPLQESIAHYKRMRAYTLNDFMRPKEYPTSDSCALCECYNDFSCDGCPVSNRTGRSACEGSPWNDAYRAFRLVLVERHEQLEALVVWHAACDAEIEFLESLEEIE